MPMLPFLANGETWHERGPSKNTRYTPFTDVASEICLACASPLNTDCGFTNLSLRRVADEETDAPRWRIETLSCMCAHCDEHCAELSADGRDAANRRERLLARHNFARLDALLGVDEPLAEQARFEHNNVPVLELRRIFLRHEAFAQANGGLRALIEASFCSFPRTVQALVSGATELDDRVRTMLGTREELERRFQINWPADIDIFDGRHWILAAAVVRVYTALELSARLRDNMRYEYETKPDTQWAVLMLQMFADTHLDLHLLCDLFARYDDEWLETPFMANIMVADQAARASTGPALVNEVIQLPPLHIAYPHPLRCVYAGEMIDATGAATTANLWTDVQDKKSHQVGSFVHVFLCKAGNHRVRDGGGAEFLIRDFCVCVSVPHKVPGLVPGLARGNYALFFNSRAKLAAASSRPACAQCMLREFDVMLCREIGNFPIIIKFVLNLLETFQLGNYPGAHTRPLWRFRKLVRRTYHYDRFSIEQWCASCNKEAQVACPRCDGARAVEARPGARQALLRHVRVSALGQARDLSRRQGVLCVPSALPAEH